MSRLLTTARQSIRAEILLSQFLIVAAASLTVIASTLILAPYVSDRALRHLEDVEEAAALDAVLHADTRTAIEETMFLSISLSVAIASLVAVAISLAVARRIVEPIDNLVASGEQMAAGDFSVRAPQARENELGDLARSFNALAAALESAEERRLQLLTDVAHEFRTPLATVQANLEGLVERVIEPEPELWVSLLHETRRLRHLVDDLHELSRAEAGQLEFDTATVDPEAIIEDAARRFLPQFEQKDVALQVEPASEALAIRADESRAVQVITNVLSNALRYTQTGGEVTVSLNARDGASVAVQIRDTGAGIAAEDIPHVFERFFRAESARTRDIGGTGIGLTIAQALMAHQGGSISLESDGLGKGTKVTLTFRRARP